jgi:hypothetical protein
MIRRRTRFAKLLKMTTMRSVGPGRHPILRRCLMLPVHSDRLPVIQSGCKLSIPTNRFPKIKKEMKLLNRSTFLDYMQPFRDTQDALFRLLSHMRIEWIPEASTCWELSKTAYAETNLTELSESVLPCPICLGISSLGLYYSCSHECCSACVDRNEQKVCSQCRKPPRPSGNDQSTADDARLRQFNDVIKKLLYRCPCGKDNCKATTFANAHKSECPDRFACPLAGDNDCRFRAGAGRQGISDLYVHLTQYHTMEHLWHKYRVDMSITKVHENIVDPWVDKNKLMVFLRDHACAVSTQEMAGTTPGSAAPG